MIVSVVLVLVAKFEEKNKAGSRSFRIAAPVAKLSSPLDEACLNMCLKEREKEREIWFDSDEKRERERKKSSKKFISPEFSSFLPFLLKYRTLIIIYLS